MPRSARIAITGAVALVAALLGTRVAVGLFGPHGMATYTTCDPPAALCGALRVMSGTEDRAVVAIWVTGGLVFAVALGLVAWWVVPRSSRPRVDS